MKEFIVFLILGAAFIPIGVFTMLGNPQLLKYRSRKKLSEANVRPFCFLYGIGIIILAVGFIIGAFALRLSGGNELALLTLVPFFAVQLILSIIATVKYNR